MEKYKKFLCPRWGTYSDSAIPYFSPNLFKIISTKKTKNTEPMPKYFKKPNGRGFQLLACSKSQSACSEIKNKFKISRVPEHAIILHYCV